MGAGNDLEGRIGGAGLGDDLAGLEAVGNGGFVAIVDVTGGGFWGC